MAVIKDTRFSIKTRQKFLLKFHKYKKKGLYPNKYNFITFSLFQEFNQLEIHQSEEVVGLPLVRRFPLELTVQSFHLNYSKVRKIQQE